MSRSRQENKHRDLFKHEAEVAAGFAGSITAILLATLFFVLQSLMGDGFDFGLYAVIFSVPATSFIVKVIRMRRRHDIVLATVYTLAALILSGVHIHSLIAMQGG